MGRTRSPPKIRLTRAALAKASGAKARRSPDSVLGDDGGPDLANPFDPDPCWLTHSRRRRDADGSRQVRGPLGARDGTPRGLGRIQASSSVVKRSSRRWRGRSTQKMVARASTTMLQMLQKRFIASIPGVSPGLARRGSVGTRRGSFGSDLD